MNIEKHIKNITSNTSDAYQSFIELQNISSKSNDVYPYFNQLFSLVDNNDSNIRMYAMILLFENTKWDIDNLIDQNIDKILNSILDTEPSVSSKLIHSLSKLMYHKESLIPKIMKRLKSFDPSIYSSDTCKSIQKEIDALILELQLYRI